ncbi:MAG: AraC family transcriptional regulator ligand-binding domain-containing protein [Rhodobacteraceae bacterium]|nr:AraC family transcriptional regulator ligand-binding domain-containing protein [Paracoccaceae bacterium]
MTRLFVPMTKATGFGPLPDVLEKHAGSKALPRAFQLAGLPMDIIEFPEFWLPVASMHALFEISAREAGDRCFGLSVGQDMSHASFGLWIKYCAQAGTLADGLNRVISCAPFQQTGCRMILETSVPISFWRYVAPKELAGSIQHCDHLIVPMIHFVQSYLGPEWQPEWVDLNYPRDDLSHQLESQLPFPVRYGASSLTLAIKADDLFRSKLTRVSARQSITFADVQAAEASGPSKEPLKSVYSAITLRLLDGHTDIQGAACVLGIGVQPLQRNLRREGVNYRALLDIAKLNRAQALLADTGLPVTEIALALGYNSLGNFSRAFKRLVGLAPMTYRGLHLATSLDQTPAD